MVIEEPSSWSLNIQGRVYITESVLIFMLTKTSPLLKLSKK